MAFKYRSNQLVLRTARTCRDVSYIFMYIGFPTENDAGAKQGSCWNQGQTLRPH